MDRRQRLAELVTEWQLRAARGEAVRPEDLCRDHPDLLPALRHLIQFDPGRAEEPTALRDRPDASATDVAAPVPPGDESGWLAPPRQPGEIGRLGRYRVRRVVRAGGMGVVLEAEDPTLKRRVAIKVMHPRLAADPGARARFLREAEAMARLDHEHVVPVFEAAEDPAARVAYLVMPFLRGEPLDVRLRRDGRLPSAEVVRIGREAAEGLQAAHDRGLIHRDVKPSNIWLDPRGKVKVLDFGLARDGDADADLSQDGRVVGTPQYMAPEQARGGPVDGRADLFSLGCVLYRMATGEAPFPGPSSAVTLYPPPAPPDPREANPDVPAGLAALIRRLLAPDPASRPASAGSVARELAGLEREATGTPPPMVTPLPDLPDPWSDIHPPDDASAPAPRPAGRSRARWAGGLTAVALLVAAGVVAAAYLARPAGGTVVVEPPADPAAAARLRAARVQLADDSGGILTLDPGELTRSVPPGAYRVMIHGERLDPDPPRIEVRRADRVTVRVVGAPNMVLPPKKTLPANADPVAAEWAQGLRGQLELRLPNGRVHEVKPGAGLPPGPFTVRTIRLANAAVAGGLFRLEGLKDLQTLDLTRCQVADPDLAAVGKLAALRELTVATPADPGRVTDAGLGHLADLTGLTAVGFPGTSVTGTGLAHLRKIAGLREVRGLGRPTDAGLAALAHFPKLTVVDLGEAQPDVVTDAGLKHLAGLDRLEVLHVHNSGLTDAGLKALTGLKRLRELGADGTGLTDTGLAHLGAFPDLESLGLGARGVTDVGLKTVGGLKTLKWLNVRGAGVTAAGVADLRRALPGCRIESDHGSFDPK